MQPRTAALIIVFVFIAGAIVWLVDRMARTAQGDYRLLVIGGAIAVAGAVVVLAGGLQRLRR